MQKYNHDKIGANDILRVLRSNYCNGYRYRINNAYIFNHDWESDYFCVSRSDYMLEFEIKISRSDFFADFKKTSKHDVLAGRKDQKLKPHRFYYVTPKGLLKLEEIPDYAGLIEIDYRFNKTKEAPLLHRNKIDLRRFMCDKFYLRYEEMIRRYNVLNYEYKLIEGRLRNGNKAV